MSENKIKFDNAAKDWDLSDFKQNLSKNITSKMLDVVNFTKNDTVMDFGCGTGLIGLNIAPFVKKLIGVDISDKMLDVFNEKAKKSNLNNTQTLLVVENAKFDNLGLDSVVSAMALHHIKNPDELFKDFNHSLNLGGVLAIADLAKEDGTFHENNSGVFHFGFSKDEFCSFFVNNGFEAPTIYVAHTVSKQNKEYEILLCVAKKRDKLDG